MVYKKFPQNIAIFLIVFFSITQNSFAKNTNGIASDGEYKLKIDTKKRYMDAITNEVTACFECEKSKSTKFIGGRSLFSGGHIIVSPTMYSVSAGQIAMQEINQDTMSAISSSSVNGQNKSQPGFSIKVGNEKVFDYNLYLAQDLFFEYIEAKTNTQINHPTNGVLNLNYTNHTAFGYMTKVGFLLGRRSVIYGIFGFALFNNTNFKVKNELGQQLEMHEQGGGGDFSPKLGLGFSSSLTRHLQLVLEAYTFSTTSRKYQTGWYQKQTSTGNNNNNYTNLITRFQTKPTLTAVSIGIAYKF